MPVPGRTAVCVPIVVALVVSMAVAGRAVAQPAPATPVATPTAAAEPFAAPGVDYDVIAEVPAPDPADGYTLQLGEIAISPLSEGVERTSDDAEALTVEEGVVVFRLISLDGAGRLIGGGEGATCDDDGCDLADYVGVDLVLGPGATVTHGGPATYSLRPFDGEEESAAGQATPAAMFSLIGGDPILISHACGGRCQ